MKTLLTALTYALSSLVLSFADEVSSDMAKRAVERWLAADSSLGCRLGGDIASVRACTATNGAVFHVVKLSGGGFVVTSADTKIEPVIAFSESEDLVEEERNPLWALLTRDLAARAQAVKKSKGGAALTSAAPVPSASSPAEEKWAKLLADGPRLMGVSFVSDVRVAPLVQSKWGQEKNSIYSNFGKDCYNYYTPSHCACGCVATAMAQIMRHHRFPDGTVTVAQQSFPCTLNGVSKSYKLMGGAYDWDSMPLVPEADPYLDWYVGGATEAQRQAIGKLTYDCGVAMRMDYSPDGSAAIGAFVFNPLKEVFHFANAHPLFGSISQQDCANAIFANLDAGCPVIVGLDGHEVVADGYGYSAQTPYTHLNMGWCGADDAWYALPTVDMSQFYSSAIHSITYNIFPKQTGELLTGRVLTAQGTPIAGAAVDVKYNGTTVSSVATDERGIYAFVVTGNRKYTVRAEALGQSSTITASVGGSTDPVSIDFSTGRSTGSTACGNSWGNDIALSDVQGVEPPVFNPGSCRFTSSVNVSLTCPTAGAVIHYALDGTDPTESSAVYSSPLAFSETTTVKARAFKAGANPSPVATATYTFTPPHDMFSDAQEIRHANGASIISNIGCTREEGEPDHSSIYDGAGVSVWWKWTAPGSGDMTLEAGGNDGRYYINPLLAVYTGTDVAHLTLVGESANFDEDQQNRSRLTFSANEGTTYYIAVDGTSAMVLGDITLAWTSTIPETPNITSHDVPHAWLDAQFPASGTRTAAQYEALQDADPDGDGFANWQEYLCGTNPVRTDSLPQCFIAMNGSLPVVTHNVVVPSEAAALGWGAVLKGSTTLTDWTPANTATNRFFKVFVEKR